MIDSCRPADSLAPAFVPWEYDALLAVARQDASRFFCLVCASSGTCALGQWQCPACGAPLLPLGGPR